MIEVQSVSKRFGPRTALDRINLKADNGEIICLLGPNGSGKTTLLKIIAGLVLPDQGRIVVQGADRQAGAQGNNSDTGLCLADGLGFYGRLTGFQNLCFLGALHGMTGMTLKKRIRELAECLRLEETLITPFQKLSSGQRQRLSLARALLHDPTILLLDEPMKNLDPNAQMDFQHFILKQLVGVQKKTILLTTHQITEAEMLAGRVIFLKEGRILKDASILEIKNGGSSLRECYTQCFGFTGLS